MGGDDLIRLYRAGVIGCGRIGAIAEGDPVGPKPASHVGAWRDHPRTLLDAVCDLRGDRAQAVGEVFTYTAVPEMLEARGLDLDILSVATPCETHLGVVRDILGGCQPQAIICEKPIAPSSAEGEDMAALCREHGVILFVNYLRRFDPTLRREAAWLGRTVGAPRTAVGHYSGGLRDGGVHMIDLMRMFLGEGRIRAAFGGEAILDFGGVRAVLVGHDIAEHVVFDLTIEGDRGALHIERFGLDVRWERATDGYPLASGYRHLAPNGAWRDVAPRSFFRGMADHVVAVLDEQEEPVSTGEDGIAALTIIETIEAKG